MAAERAHYVYCPRCGNYDPCPSYNGCRELEDHYGRLCQGCAATVSKEQERADAKTKAGL